MNPTGSLVKGEARAVVGTESSSHPVLSLDHQNGFMFLLKFFGRGETRGSRSDNDHVVNGALGGQIDREREAKRCNSG
jgi:hypothetical protein